MILKDFLILTPRYCVSVDYFAFGEVYDIGILSYASYKSPYCNHSVYALLINILSIKL